jgi:DNA-binding CsgD family transcriptional regulator
LVGTVYGTLLVNVSAAQPAAPQRPAAQYALAVDVLTIALALALWFAVGSFLSALLGGLGDHPAQRVTVGAVIVGACGVALLRRHALCRLLQRQPTLILPAALLAQAAASLDAPTGGPYTAFTLSVLFIAAIVAPPRTVWACVLLMAAVHVGGAALGGEATALAGRKLGGILGHLVALPLAAAIFLGFVVLLKRTVADAPGIVGRVRERASAAVTPPLLPAGPDPTRALTPAERRVLRHLAQGQTAKEIAIALGVALSTVRTHIRNMKRKTGAASLAELVGIGVAFGAHSAPETAP